MHWLTTQCKEKEEGLVWLKPVQRGNLFKKRFSPGKSPFLLPWNQRRSEMTWWSCRSSCCTQPCSRWGRWPASARKKCLHLVWTSSKRHVTRAFSHLTLCLSCIQWLLSLIDKMTRYREIYRVIDAERKMFPIYIQKDLNSWATRIANGGDVHLVWVKFSQ